MQDRINPQLLCMLHVANYNGIKRQYVGYSVLVCIHTLYVQTLCVIRFKCNITMHANVDADAKQPSSIKGFDFYVHMPFTPKHIPNRQIAQLATRSAFSIIIYPSSSTERRVRVYWVHRNDKSEGFRIRARSGPTSVSYLKCYLFDSFLGVLAPDVSLFTRAAYNNSCMSDVAHMLPKLHRTPRVSFTFFVFFQTTYRPSLFLFQCNCKRGEI